MSRSSPRSRGLARGDDRRLTSGIIRHGLQGKDARPGYGPHKARYNRFGTLEPAGVFARLCATLAAEAGGPDRLMVGSTHLEGASHGGQ